MHVCVKLYICMCYGVCVVGCFYMWYKVCMRERKKERDGVVYICVLRRMEIGVQCVLNSVCVMGLIYVL